MKKAATFFKGLFHYDNFIAPALLFAFFWLVVRFLNFSIFDPISDAFADVEISDVIFSQLDKNSEYRTVVNGKLQADKDIVIVNVGNYNRGQIALQIKRLSEFNPAVIGVDVIFYLPSTPERDSLLLDAVKSHPSVVLAIKGNGFDEHKKTFSEWLTPNDSVMKYASGGFVNLPVEMQGESHNAFRVCRRFVPFIKDSLHQTLESFATLIAARYRPEAVQRLIQRGNETEDINYLGNICYFHPKPRFTAIEADSIFSENFDGNLVRGKIVLLGFLGQTLDDSNGEDRFYTPLNPRYIGKTNPDMYGVVVHANIISMILNNKYINNMPGWLEHLTGILLVLLTFAATRSVYNNFEVWYDGISKIIVLVVTMLVLFFIGWLFYAWDYKISLHPVYLFAVVLSGDWLEIYFAFLKPLGLKTSRILHKYNKL